MIENPKLKKTFFEVQNKMGRKIFVSYKYADDSVKSLGNRKSTVRSYVDKFEKTIDSSTHIYKGESDGEDLSNLSEKEIWKKLKNRIYDSSVTIVFISPNMKEEDKSDRVQWIPWEVSYSLKETSRKDKNGKLVTSKTNAMIAVVLPDPKDEYSYYFNENNCCSTKCVTHKTGKLFQILRDNKFNLKKPHQFDCENGEVIWQGDCSYIEAVKWCDFFVDYNKYIDRALKRQDNMEDYEIVKTIT